MNIIISHSSTLICYMMEGRASRWVIYSHLLGVHVELLSAHGHLFIPLHAFPKWNRTEPQQTAIMLINQNVSQKNSNFDIEFCLFIKQKKKKRFTCLSSLNVSICCFSLFLYHCKVDIFRVIINLRDTWHTLQPSSADEDESSKNSEVSGTLFRIFTSLYLWVLNCCSDKSKLRTSAHLENIMGVFSLFPDTIVRQNLWAIQIFLLILSPWMHFH